MSVVWETCLVTGAPRFAAWCGWAHALLPSNANSSYSLHTCMPVVRLLPDTTRADKFVDWNTALSGRFTVNVDDVLFRADLRPHDDGGGAGGAPPHVPQRHNHSHSHGGACNGERESSDGGAKKKKYSAVGR